MTALDLVRQDYQKAKANFMRATQKPNVPAEELEHLDELLRLRLRIMRVMEREEK